MAVEGAQEPDTGQEPSTEQAWQEVGRQFEALGESLSKAFRAAWESEETQRHMQSMQDGLEKMIDRVRQTVQEASETQQGERVRSEAEKTAEALRAAGAQTWQEARPELLSVLKKVNAELQRFTENLEREPPAGSEGLEPTSSTTATDSTPEAEED